MLEFLREPPISRISYPQIIKKMRNETKSKYGGENIFYYWGFTFCLRVYSPTQNPKIKLIYISPLPNHNSTSGSPCTNLWLGGCLLSVARDTLKRKKRVQQRQKCPVTLPESTSRTSHLTSQEAARREIPIYNWAPFTERKNRKRQFYQIASLLSSYSPAPRMCSY